MEEEEEKKREKGEEGEEGKEGEEGEKRMLKKTKIIKKKEGFREKLTNESETKNWKANAILVERKQFARKNESA